jgi:alpha-glucoside transport system substrate-binding protein
MEVGMPVSRRALLAAGGAAALGAAGCGTSQGTVRVYVVWSGDELAAFRAVMHEFSQQRRWKVELLTVGDDIDALLAGQVGRRTRPDVVLLPYNGLLVRHAEDLTPVAEVLDAGQLAAYPERWRELAKATPGGPDLGIWFKIAHKSLVWYRKDVFDRYGLREPADVLQWIELAKELAEHGIPPLAVGAADGWVLTDWFENLLYSRDPVTYQGLARLPARGEPAASYAASLAALWRRPAVSEALVQFGQLITPAAERLPGGAGRALLLQFQDSLVDVFARGRAAMVPAGDFASPVIAEYADPDLVGVFRFPGQPYGRQPLVVGGDLAVLPRPAGPGGQAVLRWLASPAAARIWAARGGFISPLADVGAAAYGRRFRPYYPGQRLLEARQATGLFDLSDQLTGKLAGGDGRGSWQIMQDFFVSAGRGDDLQQAAASTVERLAADAGGTVTQRVTEPR